MAVSATPPLADGGLPWLQKHATALHLLPEGGLISNIDALHQAFDRFDWFCRLGEGLAGGPGAPPLLDLLACQQLQVRPVHPAGLACVFAAGCKPQRSRAPPSTPIGTPLQELVIECPAAHSDHLCPPPFNTAPLAALPRLRRLTLKRFAEFHLGGLPSSLRTLRCVGEEPDELVWPSLEALALPAACR